MSNSVTPAADPAAVNPAATPAEPAAVPTAANPVEPTNPTQPASDTYTRCRKRSTRRSRRLKSLRS